MFGQVKHSTGGILGMVGPIVVKQKWSASGVGSTL